MGISVGRPRLDTRKAFRRGFALILPPLLAGEISKGEAARRLMVSRRSLGRYLAANEEAQKAAWTEEFERFWKAQLQSSSEPEEDFPHP